MPDTELYKEYDKEFLDIVGPIIKHEEVQKMKQYYQHCNTTCFDHCLQVSYYCYLIGKKLNLDYVSLARAAMLHDFFLYDWRKEQRHYVKGFFNKYAFLHGKIAYRKARRYFELNKKEKDIIENHMWPVTLFLPRYKETYVIMLVDKYCALGETKDNIVRICTEQVEDKYSRVKNRVKKFFN